MAEERRRCVGGQGSEHLFGEEIPLGVVQALRPLCDMLHVEAAIGSNLAVKQQVEVQALFTHLVDDLAFLTVPDDELLPEVLRVLAREGRKPLDAADEFCLLVLNAGGDALVDVFDFIHVDAHHAGLEDGPAGRLHRHAGILAVVPEWSAVVQRLRADKLWQDNLIFRIRKVAKARNCDLSSEHDVDGVKLLLSVDQGLIRPQNLVIVAAVNDLADDFVVEWLSLIGDVENLLQNQSNIREKPLMLQF